MIGARISTHSLGQCLASVTLTAMGAVKATPVGGAFGGLQGAKLEKEI